jgi:hypothetical protein
LVSTRLKSSTVPKRKMEQPGKAAPTRYMSVPHVLQKWFAMEWPEAIVAT